MFGGVEQSTVEDTSGSCVCVSFRNLVRGKDKAVSFVEWQGYGQCFLEVAQRSKLDRQTVDKN